MTDRRPIRIANVSGFFGDRMTAPQEMLAGPEPIDVLTGDYLAELTMLILHKARTKNASAGYAGTFLTQMEGVLGICLDRGIRVVANAGGLNSDALAERVDELAHRLGLRVRIAVISGDNIVESIPSLLSAGHELRDLDTDIPLAQNTTPPVTANAYLGAWGIARALDADADVVICPRVTDASLVVGPAAWWHRWEVNDWDRVAGAMAAGHVIECGQQVTGGNFSFIDDLPDLRTPGFPIAEVAADGTSVITKQPGTGGLVSDGTVTAQLLYEIGSVRYAGPDAVARFDTIQLRQHGPDRVHIFGTKGEPPTGDLKIAIGFDGGYRNTMTMGITGLDVERKAEMAMTQLWERLGSPEQFERCDVQLVRSDRVDAQTNADAVAQLRVTVMDADRAKVGRRFSNAVTELSLASYAGFFTTTPPTEAAPFGRYWPALISADCVTQTVRLPNGRVEVVPHAQCEPVEITLLPEAASEGTPMLRDEDLVRLPLGAVCGARSGDKGGNANIGLWTKTEDAYVWLRAFMTPKRVVELLPEASRLQVTVHPFPLLRALNIVVTGLLGDGVASSSRIDPQAKGLGELLRSRVVKMPTRLAP